MVFIVFYNMATEKVKFRFTFKDPFEYVEKHRRKYDKVL